MTPAPAIDAALEAQLPRVQGDRASAVVKLRAEWDYRSVQRIAEHGMTARGGLHANLVHAAGLGPDFQKRAAIPAIQPPVVEQRPPRPGRRRLDPLCPRLFADLA